jgi:hypothetical protein
MACRQIARQFGISVRTAFYDVEAELRALRVETQHEAQDRAVWLRSEELVEDPFMPYGFGACEWMQPWLRLRACEFMYSWLPPSGGRERPVLNFRLKPEATKARKRANRLRAADVLHAVCGTSRITTKETPWDEGKAKCGHSHDSLVLSVLPSLRFPVLVPGTARPFRRSLWSGVPISSRSVPRERSSCGLRVSLGPQPSNTGRAPVHSPPPPAPRPSIHHRRPGLPATINTKSFSVDCGRQRHTNTTCE